MNFQFTTSDITTFENTFYNTQYAKMLMFGTSTASVWLNLIEKRFQQKGEKQRIKQPFQFDMHILHCLGIGKVDETQFTANQASLVILRPTEFFHQK